MMLLLAYFVQQRNNDAAMDDLRLSSNASREELLEEIEALKKENQSLTNENGRLNDWADQKSEEAKQLNDTLDQTYYRTSDLTIEKQALYYLWYLQQFMDQGDYTLAAAEIVFSTDFWRSAWENEISLNSALLEQYDAAQSSSAGAISYSWTTSETAAPTSISPAAVTQTKTMIWPRCPSSGALWKHTLSRITDMPLPST